VVTVLIGVFDLKSGIPIAGVINQPFANFDKKEQVWKGKVYWGFKGSEKGSAVSSRLIILLNHFSF